MTLLNVSSGIVPESGDGARIRAHQHIGGLSLFRRSLPSFHHEGRRFVIVRFHCYRYLEQKKRKGAVFSNELVAILADEAEQISEEDHSKRRQALESCLGTLSSPESDLVLAPYLHHGRIKELAELGGTSANALYKKLGRLRNRLRNCVKERLAQT